jgi:hypothetical protein
MEEKKVFQNIIRIDPNFTTIYGPQAVVSTVNIKKHQKPTTVQTREMLCCRCMVQNDIVSYQLYETVLLALWMLSLSRMI